ncbi:MAG: right-handed parallel beta-helix repeat-containing protein, partial [Cohnella sp.]|nr:right-handed parallel beta-helix repeat-containing protein [Cohnella sp.]
MFNHSFRTMKAFYLWVILAALIAGSVPIAPSQASAADVQPSDCDRTIALNVNQVWSAAPGDTVCVEAGDRNAQLLFANLAGTADKPIRIVNLGGIVNVTASIEWGGALEIRSSKYVYLSGAGVDGVPYGFKVTNNATFGNGVDVNRGSSNVMIEGVEVSKAGFAGIMMRTDSTSDATSYPAFVQENTVIRHSKVSQVTANGADGGYGIFLGIATFGTANAQGRFPHALQGVRVHDNVVSGVDRDALRIFGATADVRVYSNILSDYGAKQDAWKNNGLFIGQGTTGLFYGNTIGKGRGADSGAGINNQGRGDIDLFNNLIVEPGLYGIVSPSDLADSLAPAGNLPTRIAYNTIVHPNAEGNGIRLRTASRASTDNTVERNIVVHRAEGLAGNYVRNDNPGYAVSIADNFMTQDINAPGFVDLSAADPLARDYRLTNGAAAAGKGYAADRPVAQETWYGPNWLAEGSGEPGTDPGQGGDPYAALWIDPSYVPDPVAVECDFIVPTGSPRSWDGSVVWQAVDGQSRTVQPGDTICVEKGNRSNALRFVNVHGTAEAPITITNYGGVVAIKGAPS